MEDRKELWIRIGIAVLLIVLFFQCGQYVVLYRKVRQRTETPRFDMRSLSLSARQTSSDFNSSLLIPDLVVIRKNGQSKAVRNSEEVVEEVFRSALPVIRATLSQAVVSANESPDSFGADLLRDDSLYLHFSSELPARILASFAGIDPLPDFSDMPEAERFFIREILFLPDDDGQVSRVCFHSSSGMRTVTLYSNTADTKTAYESILEQYSDVFTECKVFPSDAGAEVVFSDRVLVRQITSGGSTVYLFRQVNDDVESLLRLFSFNPDKLNIHSEPDGTYTCVESHGIFRIGNTGISYLANETGGVSLSGLSGASAGQERDERYYLHICSFLIEFISEMDHTYIGGDARLYLDSVTSQNDQTVTFRFCYRSDNIPCRLVSNNETLAEEENEQGMTVTFSGNRLVEFSLNMMTIRKTAQYVFTAVPTWVADYLGAGIPYDIRLTYVLNGWQSEPTAAEWAVKYTDTTDDGVGEVR